MMNIDLTNSKVKKIRKALYYDPLGGFYVIKGFLESDIVNYLRGFWLNSSIDSLFSDFISNKSVTTSSPNYFSCKPNPCDRSYCCFLWNSPPDQTTHEISYFVHLVRNRIEGSLVYRGLANHTGSAMQYRVCNHMTNDIVVHPHADFVEMYRRDPTASHEFDPSRLQATLILSTPNVDYFGDSLILTRNNGSQFSIGNSSITAGDLILWRYTNLHSVEKIQCSNEQSGFLRIIYPSFDVNKNDNGCHSLKFVGRVGNNTIYIGDDDYENS